MKSKEETVNRFLFLLYYIVFRHFYGIVFDKCTWYNLKK